MKVLNYGSLNMDYVYTVEHIVVEGETLSSLNLELFCGGKGLNQSIALARAGVSVYHAGMIGEDGQALLDICKEGKVDTRFIKQIEGKSGHTIIQVDRNGQNSIILFGGSNQSQTKEHIDEVISFFDHGDVLLLQNEVNFLDYIIEKAFERGMQIILNPSPFNEKVQMCDLKKVSLFLLNEIEGSQITSKWEPEEILKEMLMMYPNAKIVLTLGGDGAIYKDAGVICRQGIFKTQVVDTTAAGDTFTGYFIASMLENGNVTNALKIAAKAASIAVSKHGAIPSIPLRKEVVIE